MATIVPRDQNRVPLTEVVYSSSAFSTVYSNSVLSTLVTSVNTALLNSGNYVLSVQYFQGADTTYYAVVTEVTP
jgi:hypothetical protein